LPYKHQISEKFNKDFNSLDIKCRENAKEHGIAITNNPHIGKRYTGKWSSFMKYDLTLNSIHYRVVYAIYYCKKQKEDKTYYCSNNITHHNDQLQYCEGLIDYVYFKTRQAMDNLYNIGLKDVSLLIRYKS